MYSSQHINYYHANNTNTIPQYSRSSYNLQQYAQTAQATAATSVYSVANISNNQNHKPIQNNPQLLGQSQTNQSQSMSNLRVHAYYTQNNNNNQTRAHAHARPHRHPYVRGNGSTSGIVLQSLSSNTNNNRNQMSTNAAKIVCDNNMNANLQQFAKYSSLQLQQVLSQYPQWLQKEYMRRLQRQYEELYVVEDPKIHHWSNICPRGRANSNASSNGSNGSSVANDDVCGGTHTKYIFSDTTHLFIIFSLFYYLFPFFSVLRLFMFIVFIFCFINVLFHVQK